MFLIKSVTFWVNLGLLATGLLIPDGEKSTILISVAVGNIMLRIKTERKIK